MLLLIMCRDLEVADRRMTTAIKLVLAHAFGAGATAWGRPLMGDGVLNRGSFAPRGASALRPDFGAQLLLERFVRTDVQPPALPVHGFGTLGPQGTHGTHRRRKLGRLARNHRDTLAPWTGDVHTRKVQSDIRCRAQRTHWRPGARDHVHALRGPWGHPGAGHGAEVDSKLEQARRLRQLLGQQVDRLMRGLMRRADHDLPDDLAIPSPGTMLCEAVESCGAALAGRGAGPVPQWRGVGLAPRAA
jgi:hypothetical protein